MPPATTPDGVIDKGSPFATLDFSSWLGLIAESHLRSLPGWQEATPMALGSWARGELCPNSDLDVLFCGDPKAVADVVGAANEKGLPLRYRMPEDPGDWSQGVDIFDTNALLWAKPFSKKAAELLSVQKEMIFKKRRTFRRALLQSMVREQKRRRERYDSIANFLEPNLKFGPGGLRDILQGEMLRFWYPERFQNENHAFRLLSYFRKFFMIMRQKLHLEVGLDVFVASEQADMARWFSSKDTLTFMGEVQKGLSRVSFYADWIVASCRLSQAQWEDVTKETSSLRHWRSVFHHLSEEPGIFTEFKIRRTLQRTVGFTETSPVKRTAQSLTPALGRQLRRALGVDRSDDQLRGLFRGRVLPYLLPEFQRIVGLVQHDQYHRYTVDAHLLQTLRQVQRAYNRPKSFGRLHRIIQSLTAEDWEILMWTALYHDLGKGRTGDHEEIGAAFVKRDFGQMGFPKKLTNEVSWMVQSHLLLSQAAFRRNIQQPRVWEDLQNNGVKGKRVDRLTLFTAIDIRATNPQAWTSWKEALLFELAETLKSPSMARRFQLSLSLQKKNRHKEMEFVQDMDGVLIESLPSKLLLRDICDFFDQPQPAPLVRKGEHGYLWVRFCESEDRPGLFYHYVSRLNRCGCNIRYAAIRSYPSQGVYDWFQVKTRASAQVLLKQLSSKGSPQDPPAVKFSRVELVQEDPKEWVFSFKAKDTTGLLLKVSHALMEQGLDVLWARVLTWGRQIDDVIAVRPHATLSAKELLQVLRVELTV